MNIHCGIDLRRTGDVYQNQLGDAFVMAANGSSAARTHEPMYVPYVAVGGSSGQPGGNGLCLAVQYTADIPNSYSTLHFGYTGGIQRYVVPDRVGTAPEPSQVTFKCWGGGGAGGKVSDLAPMMHKHLPASMSDGGAGAFAQLSVYVLPGDSFEIVVGGGGLPPNGERPGVGGYGGGGSGGMGLHGGGGGGGGGASYITVSNHYSSSGGHTLLLVAAGGGGGGSTDYCCAPGGAGGDASGANGGYPANNTAWKITAPGFRTPIIRRYEYTSVLCPDDFNSGGWCISEWDTLPGSLPAEHKNLEYGQWPTENYSAWSIGGGGGSVLMPGEPGSSGSFIIREAGDAGVIMADGIRATFALQRGWRAQALQGHLLAGGRGGDGEDGGGGGGSGYRGGGGGGSGIDGAGGGGGCSLVNTSYVQQAQHLVLGAVSGQPTMAFVNSTAVTLSWMTSWQDFLWGPPIMVDIEMSEGPNSQDFRKVGFVVNHVQRTNRSAFSGEFVVSGLQPSSTYVMRVVPIFSRGRGYVSQTLLVTTLADAVNSWEPVIFRQRTILSEGRGIANTVLQRPHLDAGVEIYGQNTWADPTRLEDAPTNRIPSVVPSGRRGHSVSLIDDSLYMFGGRTNGMNWLNDNVTLVCLSTLTAHTCMNQSQDTRAPTPTQTS